MRHKLLKQILAVMLSAAMVLTSPAAMVFAEEGRMLMSEQVEAVDEEAQTEAQQATVVENFEYKMIQNIGGEETIEITKYTGSDTDVVIPAQINGKKVTSIGAQAFRLCSSLQTVTIPKGVTNIGESAFAFCDGLTSITIPEGVTNIGKNAFSFCESLASITIPKSVTDIGVGAFSFCSSLTSILIPKGVMYIGEAVLDCCPGLAAITVEEGNEAYYSGKNNCIIEKNSNTIIAGCKTTTIPKEVTSIGNSAFSGCTDLTSITIPEGVTNIGSFAFYECSSLTNIVIPKGVTRIRDYTFDGCISLESVVIPEGVTSIGGNAFYECSSLTSIVIPEGVTRIEHFAFEYCTNLVSIIIPESVTTINQGCFWYCPNLTIHAKANSYAIQYAIDNDIPYKELICTHENTEFRNVKPATCAQKGYTGDTYCVDCDEKLADGTATAALGHSYKETITRQPSVTKEGVKTYTCSRCGDSYTEAIAKLSVSYTVKFKGNGATSGSMSNQKITYGSKAKLTANKFKKKGYTFVGWNTKKDGSGTSYKNKADASKMTTTNGKKITLYAQWAASKYTITFDGNGSTSGSMKKISNCKYGTTYTLTKNSFKKKGYTFTGWNTKKDGSGTSYKNKAKIKNLSEKLGKKVTLYAQWKKTKYTITYKLNKGTNHKSNPSSYYITTKTITLKKPTRKGYTFVGWYSDKKCTKKVTMIKKGSTGDITLYAKWKKKS